MINSEKMDRSTNTISERPGSLLIDALLAIVIFAVVIAAFSSAVLEGKEGSSRGGNRIRATYLAGEGLEGVRAVRDAAVTNDSDNGYDTFTASYPTGTDYGVKLDGANWDIVAGATTIDTVFTRTIRFYVGVDENQRIVESEVNWVEPGSSETRSVIMNTFFTNFTKDPPPPPPVWSSPIYVSSIQNPYDFEMATLEKIAVKDGYAYIVASDSDDSYGLFVVDIDPIETPTLESSVNIGAQAYDIVINGNYAYLATDDTANELKIIDISGAPSVSCCANTIDLDGSSPSYGISITGTGLFIVRGQSADPELFVYDIGGPGEDESPTLIASYESDTDGTRDMYDVTATGSSPGAFYAYVATNYTTEELSVISMTGAGLTGHGDAPNVSNPQDGMAIAIYGTGAFLGVKGDNANEVFSYNITNRVFDPYDFPSETDEYDLGGDGANDSPSETSVAANDMVINKEYARLFIASNIQRDCTPTCVNHYLHILDVSNVRDMDLIYDGNIAAGYNVDRALFYRDSDHMLFMVGGDIYNPSDLLILRPLFIYQ